MGRAKEEILGDVTRNLREIGIPTLNLPTDITLKRQAFAYLVLSGKLNLAKEFRDILIESELAVAHSKPQATFISHYYKVDERHVESLLKQFFNAVFSDCLPALNEIVQDKFMFFCRRPSHAEKDELEEYMLKRFRATPAAARALMVFVIEWYEIIAKVRQRVTKN